jgi:DNA-binding SARP family transcriptional activator
VEFRILGPLEVRHEGRPVHIGGAKERALLALLLLHAGEPVSVDRLIDELWGASPPATARKSVQVRVAGLRRAVRGDVLLTRGDAYLVRLEPNQLDLQRFEHLLSEADRALAAGDPSAAVATLDGALVLWRGPPLADFAYESFAQPAIARLEELRVRALELRVEAQLELGLHARVIVGLEDLVAAHPFRERLREQLMLALFRDGPPGGGPRPLSPHKRGVRRRAWHRARWGAPEAPPSDSPPGPVARRAARRAGALDSRRPAGRGPTCRARRSRGTAGEASETRAHPRAAGCEG